MMWSPKCLEELCMYNHYGNKQKFEGEGESYLWSRCPHEGTCAGILEVWIS